MVPRPAGDHRRSLSGARRVQLRCDRAAGRAWHHPLFQPFDRAPARLYARGACWTRRRSISFTTMTCPGCAKPSRGCWLNRAYRSREEFLVRHKDGSWRPIEAVPSTGSPSRPSAPSSSTTATSPSGRRGRGSAAALEARYRSLIQGAAYGLFRTTLDGRILDANPAFANMLGYDSVEELKTVNIASVYAKPDARAGGHRAHLRSRGRTLSGKFAWRKKDGTTIIVR